jgi:hypothetical protein
MKEDIGISKLSIKVQEYIKTLQIERATALRALNEFVDNQTKSPFFIKDSFCTGEKTGPTQKICYIQTNRITVEHGEISLEVRLRDETIEIKWGGLNYNLKNIALIPYSYQCVRLISKKDMID